MCCVTNSRTLRAGRPVFLAQQLTCFDAFQPKDHRKQKSEQHFAYTVAIVALRKLDILTQRPFEAAAS